MDPLQGEELTMGEAAAIWGVTREHWHVLVKAGVIPARLILRRPTQNGTRPVVLRSELLRFKFEIMGVER